MLELSDIQSSQKEDHCPDFLLCDPALANYWYKGSLILRDQEFADSPLKGSGFELPVPLGLEQT
jgi:hypothetical protein